MKTVLVPIADGTEEIEAVTVIDVLRRAGAEVTVAAADRLQVTASRGVKLVADCLLTDCTDKDWDLVVVPGGIPGAEHLGRSRALEAILRAQAGAGRRYAAICAAPAVVLQPHGLLDGLKATCHPGFADRLAPLEIGPERVVVDGTCITSRGPGTALEFSLVLVRLLFGEAVARQVAEPMLPHPAIDY